VNQISFPFDITFQRKILKLALVDDSFCTIGLRYLHEGMFGVDIYRWIWRQIKEERIAKRTPTLLVIQDKLRAVEIVARPRYENVLNAIETELLTEEAYIRHALEEFVKRNMFVEAFKDSQQLYNTGKVTDAIDLMQKATQKIVSISFNAPDRYWFYDELEDRQRLRKSQADREFEVTFPTGITGVDEVLDGGLSLGELGVWLADAKGGKSLLLVHLAAFTARALRRNVLLVLLEGSYLQTASRLDAWHTRTLYSNTKRGIFDREVMQQLRHEYQMLSRRIVIRTMTRQWTYTAADIRTELDDLRSQFGWVPAQLLCDYGDLLRSQDPKTRIEEEHQRNAFSDLKTISTQDQGYSVWSATQGRRPSEPIDRKNKEKGSKPKSPDYKFGKRVLGPRDVSDSYNKVRRVDFLGSINQDAEDEEQNIARLYCALYRDNAAGRLVKVRQILDQTIFVDVLDSLNRPNQPSRILEQLESARKKEAAPKDSQLSMDIEQEVHK
jgi:replicative DNA helicase